MKEGTTINRGRHEIMREDEIGGRTIGINQKTLEVNLNFKKGTKKLSK